MNDDNYGFVKARLREIVENLEALHVEKQEVAEQIKAAMAEAKAEGYDTKILRKVLALRKKPVEERQEEAALLDIYLAALDVLIGEKVLK